MQQSTTKPPWFVTQDDGTEIKLTYAYERYPEQRAYQEQKAQKALLGSFNNPTLTDENIASQVGIGNWVIIATDEALQLRELGFQVIQHGTAAINQTKHYELLTKLTFECLPRDYNGAAQREAGILDGSYLDLPITSVRAIKLRLYNLSKLSKTDRTYSTSALDCLRRALKILGCGQPYEQEHHNHTTGEITFTKNIGYCKTKSCGQPECTKQHYYRKRQKYKNNLLQAFTQAVSKPGTRLAHITLTTYWALPKGEGKHRAGLPTLNSSGRNAHALTGSLPATEQTTQVNLYRERLQAHLDSMRAFFQAQATKNVISANPHRVTETAFLQSIKPGRRAFPNPHTHAIIEVPDNTTDNELADCLTAIFKRYAGPFAQVMVAQLQYNSKAKRELTAQALSTYDSKTTAITHQRKNKDSEHHNAHLLLDDRSFAELLEEEDFGRHVLYYSDLLRKKKHTQKSKSTVVIIQLKPERQVLGNKVRDRTLLIHTGDKRLRVKRTEIVRSQWYRPSENTELGVPRPVSHQYQTDDSCSGWELGLVGTGNQTSINQSFDTLEYEACA